LTASSSSPAPRGDPAPGATDSSRATDGSENTDVLVVGGATPDGNGVAVLRQRNRGLEAGVLQPVVHGKPIHGELVRLAPRSECPGVYDVTVELPARQAPSPAGTSPDPSSASRGPAQVASDAYRENWDRIWN